MLDALCDPYRVESFYFNCTGGGARRLPPAINYVPFQGTIVVALLLEDEAYADLCREGLTGTVGGDVFPIHIANLQEVRV